MNNGKKIIEKKKKIILSSSTSYLILSTATSYLVIAFIKNNKILNFFCKKINNKYSELLINYIDKFLNFINIKIKNIDSIVINNGPGNFTSIRLGIAFIKILKLVYPKIKIFTINTLLSIIGKNDGFVLLKAYSNNFFGSYVKNKKLFNEKIYNVKEIFLIIKKNKNMFFFGDLQINNINNNNIVNIIKKKNKFNKFNIIKNILNLKSKWKLIKKIDYLLPKYK